MRVLIVTNMYPTHERPAWGTFVRDQVESLRREGVEIDVLFIDGRKNKLNYLWGTFRLWAWLLTHRRYDLIHAHYVFSGFIARAQFLCPVVLTHHGYEVFGSWQRFPSHIISRLVDKVILVSDEQQRKLKCKNTRVIPCGVDMDLFRPLPRGEARQKVNLALDGKKYVLALWAGSLSRPVKRFDIIKSAVAIARESDPAIELVPVTGKPHDVIPLYMNACDVLLLVSDGEGSPVVIKEAMACNLPIVSVPAGDVPDIIGNTTGCYLCSQDPTDVAAKLLMAVADPARTDGREKIRHLAESAIAGKIIAVYEEVLGD